MKKLGGVICLMAIFILFCNRPSPTIQGAWKIVYQKFTNPDTIAVYTSKDFPNPQIKIFTKSYFSYGFKDSDGDGYGGGRYTLNGDKYIETASYSVNTGFINKPITYTIKLIGDTLIFTGYLDSENKEQLLEKYIRLE